MRTRIGFIGAFALAAATVACGDDNGTSTGTTAPTTATVVLLTVGDVGSVWKLSNAVNDADYADAFQMPCADTALNPTIKARLTPTSGVQFEPVDHGYQHLIEMVVTGEAARLDADLAIYIEALQACSANPSADLLSYDQMMVLDMGDQSATFEATAYESGSTGPVWYTRTSIVRVGGVAITLGLSEVLDNKDLAPAINDDEYVRILEAAVAGLSS
jgi:hypothetical protein